MYLYPVNLNLTIDIGNTRCKYAVFSGENILESGAESFSIEFIEALLKKFPASRRIFSSVTALSESETDYFKSNAFVSVKDCKIAPVKSEYRTMETLGEDRWAAVCGAAFLTKSVFPFLVIQVGTAITFDYVDSNGHYTGGAISPGISLRLRSLHNFTAKLPLIEPENKFEEMGKSTKDSILSGVMNGCLAEIRYRIDKFVEHDNKAPVYLGGGDAGYFDISHENHIFAVPKIVLVGLNHLLNLNP
ncbi:MAG TPA: pantothenate kinase [Bacteroidales bacterium]|nr:pantothenate kinase [Bacteroidales bacterium]HCB61427.1 pantothenate kinase [Bacteroidales bacterium]HCY23338.1 pantothenate kinase [Bacteroidales bacterium]